MVDGIDAGAGHLADRLRADSRTCVRLTGDACLSGKATRPRNWRHRDRRRTAVTRPPARRERAPDHLDPYPTSERQRPPQPPPRRRVPRRQRPRHRRPARPALAGDSPPRPLYGARRRLMAQRVPPLLRQARCRLGHQIWAPTCPPTPRPSSSRTSWSVVRPSMWAGHQPRVPRAARRLRSRHHHRCRPHPGDAGHRRDRARGLPGDAAARRRPAAAFGRRDHQRCVRGRAHQQPAAHPDRARQTGPHHSARRQAGHVPAGRPRSPPAAAR